MDIDKKVRILVIDDNPDDAALVKVYINELGISSEDVSIAATLSEGIDKANKNGIDFVLLNLNLPDSVGVETVRRFRDSLPSIPIVVYSGFMSVELREKLKQAGADDFAQKSGGRSQLLAPIMKYVFSGFYDALVVNSEALQEVSQALEAAAKNLSMLPTMKLRVDALYSHFSKDIGQGFIDKSTKRLIQLVVFGSIAVGIILFMLIILTGPETVSQIIQLILSK